MKRIISFLLALLIISSVVLTSCVDKPPCTHDDPNNIFIISAKEPDCTNTGLTEGVKCGYCGTMILPQKEIPTNENHSFTDWLVVGEPEPDEAKVETRHCRLCGKREERITEPSIDDSTDDMKYDPTQEVTITFYHSMGSQLQSILNKYIEKFNADKAFSSCLAFSYSDFRVSILPSNSPIEWILSRFIIVSWADSL